MEKTSNVPPQEVMEDILTKLPVKSLVRFRSVSKTWSHLLTSDSNFIQKHLNHSIQDVSNHVFIFQNVRIQGNYFLPDLTFERSINRNTLGIQSYIELVGSANGLVCLQECFPSDAFIYLWNPSIRKFKKLPKPHINVPPQQQFANNVHLHNLGFGYHPPVNDYSVVRICNFKDGCQVEVYSLSSNCWRIIGDFPFYVHDSSSKAVMNGIVHWIATSKDDPYLGYTIFSFDIGNWSGREISIPVDINSIIIKELYLRTFNGCLFLFVTSWVIVNCMDVWVMDKYGVMDSWTKLVTIDHLEDGTHPIDFFENGDILLDMYVMETNAYKLVSFNFERKTLTNLHLLGGTRQEHADALPYVESLVPLMEAHSEIKKQDTQGQSNLNKRKFDERG